MKNRNHPLSLLRALGVLSVLSLQKDRLVCFTSLSLRTERSGVKSLTGLVERALIAPLHWRDASEDLCMAKKVLPTIRPAVTQNGA